MTGKLPDQVHHLSFGYDGVTVLHAALGDLPDLARQLGMAVPTLGGRDSVQQANQQSEFVSRMLWQAWLRWGTEVGNHLSGSFAFAVGDADRQTIWLVRDHLGETPLFYNRRLQDVVLSCNLDALVDLPGVNLELDEEALALYLAQCYQLVESRSFYRSIGKVPPGALVQLSAEAAQVYHYWRPERVEELSNLSFPEAVELGTQLLAASVRDRIRSGKVAAHISGGLDSSLIAVIAQQQLQQRNTSLVAGMSWSPTPPSHRRSPSRVDEWEPVEQVCAQLAIPALFADPVEALRMAAQAHPLTQPPAAWNFESSLARSAAQLGADTIVTGWGGDEALSFPGWRSLETLMRSRRFGAAWRESASGKSGSYGRRVARQVRTLGAAAWHVPARMGPLEFDAVNDAAWRRFSPEIANLRNDMKRQWQSGYTSRELMLNRLKVGHLAFRSESWWRGGSSLGVRYASPLLDKRVVEFALSLPPEFLQSQGTKRRIFRAIARPYLPERICDRSKLRDQEPARQELAVEAALLMQESTRAQWSALGLSPLLLAAWETNFAQFR